MATVYEIVTERIIAKLEAGVVPWRRPWTAAGPEGAPRNLASGKPYRGLNVFLLASARYSSPWWLTFKQALDRGGHVRRGEKGTPVIFWCDGWKRQSEGGEEETVKRPVLRYYTVFNVAQCDGIATPAQATPARPFEPIAACEATVAAMPRRPAVVHGGGQACYRPSSDTVTMPEREAFRSPEAYYAVLAHELGHATGHASRLDRKGITAVAPFGTPDYSREELIAEMTSAFFCGAHGIEPATLDDSASYIASWVKVLRGDSKLVVIAGAQAQRAADFILGRRAPEAAE